MHGGGKTRNSNGIFVYAIFRFYQNYIPSDSQETCLQMYTHILSVEGKIGEILTDLNWK